MPLDPTRLTFPEDRTAFIYQAPGQPILSPFRTGLQLFTDQAATVLADVLTPTGTPLASSTIYTGADGLLPLFLGPPTVTRVWARVVGGDATTYPLFAQYAAQVAAIPTLTQGHGAPTVDLGVVGSTYLDEDAFVLYGPKGSTWPGTGTPLRGPQGPTGISGGSFEHQQVSPSTTWVIDHPLPYRPAVTTVDSGGFQIFGDVSYPLPARVVVAYSAPVGGSALLS